MQRVTSVLLSILLGAVAVGLGMGIYLHKANADRRRLEMLAIEAQDASRNALETSRQAILEANNKVKTANDEVAKAQAALRAIEEERQLMEKAAALAQPKAETLKGWIEIVSLPLEVSLRVPPKNVTEENSASALTVSTESKPQDTASADRRWLQVTPYDQRLESELVGAMASTTPVVFAVDGRLLQGSRGFTQTGETFVLRVSSLGQVTHLVWARELGKTARDSHLLQALATLDFKR